MEATGALDVHEEGVGRLDQALKLVLLLLRFQRRMQKIYVASEHLHVQDHF